MALYELTKEEQEEWLAFDAVESGVLDRAPADNGLDLLASRGA
jgi:hypothetical protein